MERHIGSSRFCTQPHPQSGRARSCHAQLHLVRPWLCAETGGSRSIGSDGSVRFQPLMCEFFTRQSAKDFSVLDVSPQWLPTPDQKQKLDHWWVIACQHVGHFSKERLVDVNSTDTSVFDAPPPLVREVQRDVLDVYDTWEASLTATPK